jgi:hypothetical protein
MTIIEELAQKIVAEHRDDAVMFARAPESDVYGGAWIRIIKVALKTIRRANRATLDELISDAFLTEQVLMYHLTVAQCIRGDSYRSSLRRVALSALLGQIHDQARAEASE